MCCQSASRDSINCHRHVITSSRLLAGDGLEAVLSGVVKGAGRQASAVPIVLFSYYCVGVPLSLLLGFQANLKVRAAAQVACCLCCTSCAPAAAGAPQLTSRSTAHPLPGSSGLLELTDL